MNNSGSFSKFEKKVVVLTGAGSGIGKSLTEKLLASGAIVYAADRNVEGLEGLAASSDLHCVPLDVTDADAFQKLASKIMDEHGRIDYLFNNAGVTLLQETLEVSFDQWKSLLDVNILGVCNGVASIYPLMIKQGYGAIINTSSIAAVTGYATATAYTCSKAFVMGLSRSLRAEAKEHGIQVTLVCPGYVKTNIFSTDKIVGADRGAVFSQMPFKSISPDKAAECILLGTLRKKKNVIFPFSAKFLWFVAHWFPSMLNPFQAKFLKPFRENGQSTQ